MANFLHGVTVTEVESGARTVSTGSSSVIGVIGTAPDAAEDFPLNTPVLIAGSHTEAAKLGESGTPCCFRYSEISDKEGIGFNCKIYGMILSDHPNFTRQIAKICM